MVVGEYERIPRRANVDRMKPLEISRQKPHDAAMTTADLESALALVRQETDLSAKSLLLAGVVSELFRERGFVPSQRPTGDRKQLVSG